jgi:hypothetical protein
MQRGVHIEIHFVEDRTVLPKIIKSGERIFWMDYGTNLNSEILHTVVEPFEKGVHILVFPCVKEGIDWKMFEKKTMEGSSEPAGQRGLTFDTEVGKKLANGMYECQSTSARVWVMDSKPVDKKLRGGKEVVKLPTEGSSEKMFKTLQTQGIKIGVMSEALVVCHFIHECFGNILEASGVKLEP